MADESKYLQYFIADRIEITGSGGYSTMQGQAESRVCLENESMKLLKERLNKPITGPGSYSTMKGQTESRVCLENESMKRL